MKLRQSLISRRRFLGSVILAEVVAMVTAVMYAPLRFLFHKFKWPLPKRIAIPLEAVQKMPVNSAQYFNFGWMPGILLRRSQEHFTAFNATCTHLDCTITYQPGKKHFLCNCHLGIFNLEGVNIEGPPPRPLEQLNVEIEGDRLIISRQTEPQAEGKNNT